jgi:transposase
MGEVSTIGLDLAKNVFQVHGADASGAVLFRKKLRRHQVLAFFAGQKPCTVAMEACSSSHHWAREISRLGHQVRLIPPAYVKPFVKRQKNDAADAEAICEAAQRPTMRFVVPKSEQTQAAALVFRARDLLVKQRTQVINALRGHLAEFGIVAARGPAHVPQLMLAVEDPDEPIPELARPILQMLIETLRGLDEQIACLDHEIAQRAKENEAARRLLIIGANSVLVQVARHGAPAGSWIARMVARKPPMLVRVALANKMARIVWALLARGEVYRAPAATA